MLNEDLNANVQFTQPRILESILKNRDAHKKKFGITTNITEHKHTMLSNLKKANN
jgi:hypothetical protein